MFEVIFDDEFSSFNADPGIDPDTNKHVVSAINDFADGNWRFARFQFLSNFFSFPTPSLFASTPTRIAVLATIKALNGKRRVTGEYHMRKIPINGISKMIIPNVSSGFERSGVAIDAMGCEGSDGAGVKAATIGYMIGGAFIAGGMATSTHGAFSMPAWETCSA